MTVLRRVLTLPIAVALQLLFVILSPLLMLLSALVSVVLDRRFGLVRGVVMLDVYVGLEWCALVACAVVWLRSLLPRYDAHRRLAAGCAVARWLLHTLYIAAGAVLGLRAHLDGDADAVAALDSLQRPVIVLSRHAGPGDSFLVVHELLCRGRQPRIVLRAALRLDPGIDVLGTLLPLCWVRGGREQRDMVLQRTTEVSAQMDERGALLLFPEGGNVSRERMRRGVTALLRDGLRRRARQAARLQHLAAPFTGGALSAMRGAPAADVLFLAHSGLIDPGEQLLRRIPIGTCLRMHCFRVASGDVPGGDAARSRWLFDWWQRMDTWISQATV